MSGLTQKAARLRYRLLVLDCTVPTTYAFGMLLSQICRHATTKARQDEAYCSYEWADTDEYKIKMEKTVEALNELGVELERQWDGSKLVLDNDPRGFVVRILLPNGRDEAWAGGVGVA